MLESIKIYLDKESKKGKVYYKSYIDYVEYDLVKKLNRSNVLEKPRTYKVLVNLLRDSPNDEIRENKYTFLTEQLYSILVRPIPILELCYKERVSKLHGVIGDTQFEITYISLEGVKKLAKRLLKIYLIKSC
jgi:hypothetical protein